MTRSAICQAIVMKEQVIKHLIEKFESELNAITRSAKAAHEAATHEETKAEDQHDTFALEASFLAHGQATRVAELERTLSEFGIYLEQANIVVENKVKPGTLIECESEGIVSHIFFAVLGGGTNIHTSVKVGPNESAISVKVVSIHSPLGEELEDAQVGEDVTFVNRDVEKIYRIVSIT